VIEQILQATFPAVRLLLPAMMTDPRALAMLIAIGLQESKFEHRRQENFGPARGFWQFEKGGGVRGVLRHVDSRDHALRILRQLRYGHLIEAGGKAKTAEVHYALHDNDTLACAFARLLLYTVPASLPSRDDPREGWAQYLEAWRPGKPRPATWPAYFNQAWTLVEMEPKEPT
jgi:hypothetical protein